MQQHSNSTSLWQASSLRSKRKKPIEVFVSAGSFSKPYYTFKDKEGRTIEDLEINPSRRYRFGRAYNAPTHPFYISDQGFTQPSTNKIKLKGDGGSNSGITSSETFTLTIKKNTRRTSLQQGACFSTAQATHRCWTNSSLMQGEGGHNNALQRKHSRCLSTPLRQSTLSINSSQAKPMRFS